MKNREQVIIYQPSYVHDSAIIGARSKIGCFCDISKDVIIGRYVNIQCHCSISTGVHIDDGCFIAPGVRILNDKMMNGMLQPPHIGKHCRIGGNVLILPDVTIGDNCFIGAGLKVTKSLPNGSIVTK